jgi:hypothetical protein
LSRKKPTVFTVAPGKNPVAEREVWAEIHELIGLANLSLFCPQDMPAGFAGFPATISAVLTGLCEGRHMVLSPPWTRSAFRVLKNLENVLASGYRHLRACRRCRGWFLADHKTRVTCAGRSCQLKDLAVRQDRWRQGDVRLDRYWKKEVRAK